MIQKEGSVKWVCFFNLHGHNTAIGMFSLTDIFPFAVAALYNDSELNL